MTPVSRVSSGESAAFQQTIAALAAMPEIQQARRWFHGHETQIAEWQKELAGIPAPPFGESARSKWLAAKFRELGLENSGIDQLGNVIGVLTGADASFISVSAHLDTVFPPGTHLAIRREGSKLFGPSVSDNSAGVVAMLALGAAIQELQIPHPSPLLFIGNVGEEGEGDLRGMRHIFTESEWKDVIAASIVLDGAGCDTIISEALGSRRFEVVIRGPGGHSWSD